MIGDASSGDGQPGYLVALLVAWASLQLGMCLLDGTYRPEAIAVVTGSFGVFICGLAAFRTRSHGSPTLGLAIASGVCLAVSLRFDSGLYGVGTNLVRSREIGAVAAATALTTVVGPFAYRRTLGLLALACATGANTLIIVASSRPFIDVWWILSGASRRMSAGHNIFTGCWPGNVDRLTDCVYPYLPLTTVAETPFRIAFGDIRYTYVAALILTAIALWQIAGPTWGPAVAAVFMASPKLSLLVEQAWTEPLLLLGIAVMVLAVQQHQTWLAVLAFAVALACKQHAVLLLPLAAWWPAFGWRRTSVSLAIASVVTLPWFIADPGAFLHDAFWFNLRLHPRPDSLSLFSTAVRAGWTPPFALVGVVTIAALLASLTFLPRNATGFVLGSALVQFAFDLVNKQSFFNEWWFVGGLLLLGVATAVSGATTSASGAPARSRS
jgi:hypothetical protein